LNINSTHCLSGKIEIGRNHQGLTSCDDVQGKPSFWQHQLDRNIVSGCQYGHEKIVETKLLSDPEAKGHKLMETANGGLGRLWLRCNTSNIDASQG
jgi:hypothetical protein